MSIFLKEIQPTSRAGIRIVGKDYANSRSVFGDISDLLKSFFLDVNRPVRVLMLPKSFNYSEFEFHHPLHLIDTDQPSLVPKKYGHIKLLRLQTSIETSTKEDKDIRIGLYLAYFDVYNDDERTRRGMSLLERDNFLKRYQDAIYSSWQS